MRILLLALILCAASGCGERPARYLLPPELPGGEGIQMEQPESYCTAGRDWIKIHAGVAAARAWHWSRPGDPAETPAIDLWLYRASEP